VTSACLSMLTPAPHAATKHRQTLSRRLLPPTSAFAVALLALPVLFPLAFDNPQCHPGPNVSDELAALSPPSVRLFNRRESTTGVITVSENLIDNEWVRLLRCDHSLLGGLWVGPARRAVAKENGVGQIQDTEMDAKAVQQSESVYATFLIQEAVRLVDRRVADVSDKQTALIM
jgi:hypothetical protein